MPPNSKENRRIQPTLNFKYPTNRDSSFKTPTVWLEGKKIDDDTGGLWRVHDNLYDVSEFISSHPGGSTWLEITKGSDITEAFESHHISSIAEELLKKYFVRKAKNPRNSPFTFKDDGFYRTLKRNVKTVLKDVPESTAKASDLMIDSLLASTFVCAIIACTLNSFFFALVSAICLCYTTVAAHNYFHRKDNFRMYYFNFSMLDFREWRISHALSHHMFPNTIYDYEISVLEPLFQYLPCKKTTMDKYGSYLLVLPIWATVCLISFTKRIQELYRNSTFPTAIDAIPFTLPLAMLIFSSAPLLTVAKMWLFVLLIGSCFFSAIGVNAAHHHPDIFHEGDAPRAKMNVDWGIHILDSVAERPDIKGNSFLVLTHFGDHALHHFFPTLDHGTLQYLYPVLESTMKKFGVNIHMKTQVEMILGQFRQLSNDSPNTVPPGGEKK